MLKKIHIYRLIDAKGDQRVAIVNDPSDTGTIGGFDSEGVFQQYDAYEMYYAFDWAKKYGFVLEYANVIIEITDEMFLPTSL